MTYYQIMSLPKQAALGEIPVNYDRLTVERLVTLTRFYPPVYACGMTSLMT